MNKILVQLYIPMIEEQYDIYIPINKTLHKITNMLQKAVAELTNGGYIIQNNALLYNKTDGKIYNPNLTVKNSGIKNGEKIILL